MMGSADSHTARWFVGLFHQYSLSVEHWRALAETKNLECDQLRNALRILENQRIRVIQKQEVQNGVLDDQRDLIRSLEQDLERRRESARMAHSAIVAAPMPARPRTPWPPEVSLRCSSSDLSSLSPPLSPALACDTCEATEASKKRAASCGPAWEDERSPKRQHTGDE